MHDEKIEWECSGGSLHLSFDDHLMQYDGWNIDGLAIENIIDQIGHL